MRSGKRIENMEDSEYQPADLEQLRITINVAVKTRVPKAMKRHYAGGTPTQTDAATSAITKAVMDCLREKRIFEKPTQVGPGYFPKI